MEVRLRLQKVGKAAKKRYNYRIVAISRANSRQAKNLDIVGHYDPAKEPAQLFVNQEKLEKWLKRGARMSDTVRSLVNKNKKNS